MKRKEGKKRGRENDLMDRTHTFCIFRVQFKPTYRFVHIYTNESLQPWKMSK